MRNISLIDKKQVSCSFLKNVCTATVERNFMYFANQNELCKIDTNHSDAENSVGFKINVILTEYLHIGLTPMFF